MAETPQGGLNAVAPPKALPAQPQGQTPNVGMNAARVAGMETEEAPQEDFATSSLRKLREERAAMSNQIDLLQQSLGTRQNRLFDPVLMKMAAGFAKPTKTGSFGESMGYAAEMASDEAEKEAVREQAYNKMKLDLQEKKMALNKQNLMSDFMANRLGLGPQTTLGTGVERTPTAAGQTEIGAPGAAPTAGAPRGEGPGGGSAVTQTGAPRKTKMITDEDIAIAYEIGGKEFGDSLREQAKMQREDVIQIGNTPYSRSQQRFLEQNPDTVIEVDFGRYVGAKKVPYGVFKEWEAIKKRADETGNPEIENDWFRKKNWISGKPGQTPATPEEEKIEKELNADRIKRQNEEESKKIGQLDTSFLMARTNLNVAKDMISFATNNPRAFELLNNPGIKDAIGRALQEGLSTPGGAVRLPMQQLATYKLSGEDRDALNLYLQSVAKLQVQSRKLLQGQGAITESEGRLTNDLQALSNDTARVVRLKSEALILDSKFDQAVHKAWTDYTDKNPGGTFRKFLQSEELGKIRDHYDQQADRIRKANADLLGKVDTKKTEAPKVTAPATVPAAPPAAPAEPPKASPAIETPTPGQPPRIKGPDDPVFINLPKGSLYKDENGVVRRKK